MFWLWQFADTRGPARPTPMPQPGGKAPTGNVPVDPADSQIEEEEELNTVSEEINETLALLMPWAISFLAHFGLILLAFFVVWSVRTIIDDPPEIVPSSQFNPSEKMTLVVSDEADVSDTENITREVETTTVARGDPSTDVAQIETADMPSVLGTAASNPLPFGTIAGTDATGVGFMGVGGNARDVVFVVDASGSLIDSLPFVIQRLQESILQLNEEHQRFSVIFFQRGTFIEKTPPGLQPATARMKQQTVEWMDLSNHNIIPRGESTPERALEVALRYRPDLIYILSDNITGFGRYSIDSDKLLSLVEQTKQQFRAETKINTIQYLYEDEMETLKKIAEQHGGIYKFIDPSYVGLQ